MMTRRRKRTTKSCIFCRRSHVVCDEKRPCTRCIKREIAHLCTTEEPLLQEQQQQQQQLQQQSEVSETPLITDIPSNEPSNINMSNFLFPQTFISENMNSEFSSLNEFFSILDDPLLSLPVPNIEKLSDPSAKVPVQSTDNEQVSDAKEKFFLTAADPSIEITPEERLKLVINAKVDAGLLKPYDYAKGYARLQNYMDKNMTPESKQRVLKPLNSIRPAFRSIAKSLKDVDLVLVEESFEKMLLSYDRVFTSMSIPACIWRRTGEIYRANKEFATLVECTVDDLRDGKMAIYELMTEDSTVSFWEKYGSVAFDKGQKAVLTSCILRTRDSKKQNDCCFSFTIRRDRYNIPVGIVGNFIPI
ncbi:hypothetical protein KAFR_0H02600 [Kazachstania africana CBS 2517]|uniref:Zn(2)-C6 fungal-type domain-containing protein n=1 Tax=Kazachstania africana (strain ATCC 22294 / BCRC 22015 / CBS 2517 / CECT 1963 / NBRC 1671 / NRRL Y-8276) TaxID=1071382 RepID=H2AZB3_KAZAF|nr:hypothetical protein KAFR_0H02600 [Kazachstania africana CBS 2517]CCF59669.1 hypothetical protein KAFR_0H02600 [Kazachstania africana CBS 2517]